MKRNTLSHIRFKLSLVEWVFWRYPDAIDTAYYKWKRHYLIKRLCALQIKEFDRGG